MQSISDFFQRNPFAFFLFLFVWILLALFWFCFRLFKRPRHVFPKVSSEEILFDERMASGRSFKSWFSRFGGARNCLRITVTKTEVWMRLFFPFSVLAKDCDLDHRISKTRITSMKLKDNSTKNVFLDFQDEEGRSIRLELVLRERERFLKALEKET